MNRVAAQATVLTASVISAIAFIVHWPCRNSGYVGDRFTSMCYSDLAAFLANPPLSTGESPFGGQHPLDVAPLPGLMLWVIAKLSTNFITLVVITQLVLVVAFFFIAQATFTQRFWKPLDAAVVMSMPLWPFVLFISTDVLAVCFAALSLSLWSRQRLTGAAIIAGLALLSGGWTWVLLVAIVVEALRYGRKKEGLVFVGRAIVIACIGNIPILLAGGNVFRWNSQIGDGSGLMLVKLITGNAPALANVIAVLGVLAVIVAARWAFHQPFEFRTEALLLLFVTIELVSSPSISPQSLTRLAWLIPLVFVTRRHVITYSVILIGYVMSVWLHFEGTLNAGKGEPDQAHALITAILLAALAFLMFQTINIIRVQGIDPVRQAFARFLNDKQPQHVEE
jgi:hypothetical protein